MKQLPQKANCIVVGKFTKLHGICGLVLKWDKNYQGELEPTEPIFLNIYGGLVPFFICQDGLTLRSEDIVCKLENIDNKHKAEQLTNLEVYIKSDTETKQIPNPHFYSLVGYTVIDSQHGNIGQVSEFIDIKGNPLLSVNYNNNEILIPAVQDQIITTIDSLHKIVYVNIPDGLLELYTNK